MRIVPVPCLSDNYAYLVIDGQSNTAMAVDPVEPDKVLGAAQELGVTVTTVLTTHKHWDHSGGNEQMGKRVPGLVVVGSAEDSIPALTRPVKNEEGFLFGNLAVTAFLTPCHTRGHVLYFITDQSEPEEPPAIFTGDTLFIAGCGRFFEGSPTEMYYALVTVISNLPSDTRVYCGHEYTVSNLLFARTVEPDNSAVKAKLEWAQKERQAGRFTVPSTVAEEKSFNPFMRVREPTLAAAVNKTEPIEVMAALRRLKDAFKAS